MGGQDLARAGFGVAQMGFDPRPKAGVVAQARLDPLDRPLPNQR